MRTEIEKIIDKFRQGKYTRNQATNSILSLMVVKKDAIEFCHLCEDILYVNGYCPQCTIDFCTPLDEPIKI